MGDGKEEKVFNFQFSRSWYWIKVSLEKKISTNDLLLNIDNAKIEFINLYFLDDNGQWQCIKNGYDVDTKDKFKQHHFQILPLYFAQNKNIATFYLQTQANAQAIPINIITEPQFERELINRNLIYGLYYGILFFIFLNNLVFGILTLTTNYLIYCSVIICYVINSTLISGYGKLYASDEQLFTLFYVNSLIAFVLMSFYAKNYLNIANKHWTGKLRIILLIFNTIAAFGSFSITPFGVMIAMQIIAGTNLIGFTVLGFGSLQREKQFAFYYLLAFFSFTVFVLLEFVYINTGDCPYFYISHFEWGLLCEVIVLAFALNRKFEFEQKALQIANQKAQAENLQLIQDQNILLEKKVASRTLVIEQRNQELLSQEEEIRQNMEELMAAQEQLNAQHEILIIKDKNISDSIEYAKRIQNALLPRFVDIQDVFPDSFVLFRPKDVISGDFYWFANKENLQIIIAADCTGHGVPGAFMSMLGSSLLSNIIDDKEIHEPNKILDLLHSGVEEMLNQRKEDSENRDGMDAAICVVNSGENRIEFAGANNSMYVLSQEPLNFIEVGQGKQIMCIETDNWKFTELKADRKSIGGRVIREDDLYYSVQKFQFDQEFRIYLASDGFGDQIGGKKRQKLLSRSLKELLIANHHKPYKEQELFLNDFFEDWMSDFKKQLDDVMVLGIKITKQ